jgi:hypothetical protein
VYAGDRWRYLAFPYQYMLLVYKRPGINYFPFPLWLDEIRLAWRRTPLIAITDRLGSCGLPMGQSFARVCHGDFGNRPFLTLARWLPYVLGWFWQSRFFTGPTPWGMSLDQWATWSIEDPSFILNVAWPEETPLLDVLTSRQFVNFRHVGSHTKLKGAGC